MSSRLTLLECYTIIVLFLVNIINYMDRYTIAGILPLLKTEFDVGDDYLGLLQTGFIVSYTVFAPMFGYLGDRYSRRIILILSVIIWTGATLLGSYMRTYNSFFLSRTIVGVGEASYSVIAPTVIFDVTYKEVRKAALALFYIAIPIGAGLGYVVGAKVATIFGHWCWGMRVSPLFAIIGCMLMCFCKDPVRGERERLEMGIAAITRAASYRYQDDIKSLFRNTTYILSTFGFTSVTFVVGALSWWGAKFLYISFRLIPGREDMTLEDVALKFGVVAVLAGFIGVPFGAIASYKLSPKYPYIDPIICGVGALLSDPLLLVAILYANKSTTITYVCIFVGQSIMNVTWTITAEILFSVVVPEVRSTAEAIQIVIGHSLGDAGSPYLTGLMTELWRKKMAKELSIDSNDLNLDYQFRAMQYSLFSITFVLIFGGVLFISTAFFIVSDRQVVINSLITSGVRKSRVHKIV